MAKLYYKDPSSGAFREYVPIAKMPKEIRDDIAGIKALLAAVRDALKDGDTDRAIDLLDTFLLDEGVLK